MLGALYLGLYAATAVAPVVPVETLRVTQMVVEVFTPALAGARSTQVAVELWTPLVAGARTTHALIEVWNATPARAHTTQAIVELWMVPPVCVTGAFPVDDAGQGGSCRATPLP